MALTNFSSITRNASTSPLLKLPGELREKIFRLVVGDQFIHVRLGHRGECRSAHYAGCTTECDLRLQYATCVATVSENKAYKDFSSGYTDVPQNISLDYYTPTCGERHQGCKPWNENGNIPMIEGKLEQKGLDLSMLGASRQVYEEASLLLWSTNTFSFEDPESFDKFLKQAHFSPKEKGDEDAHQHSLA